MNSVDKHLKNKTAYNGKMSKMSSETYAFRRKIMDILYECRRKGFFLPRVEVRILDSVDACAYAYLGKSIVHFNKKYLGEKYEDMLTQIVLHEVVHAVFAVGEVEGCRLMWCSRFWRIRPTKSESWEIFGTYYKEWKR
jgi:hypothetical protein